MDGTSKVLRSTSALVHRTPAQAAETGILKHLSTSGFPWPSTQLEAFLPLELAGFIYGMANTDKLHHMDMGRACFEANVEKVFQQLHPNEGGSIKTVRVPMSDRILCGTPADTGVPGRRWSPLIGGYSYQTCVSFQGTGTDP